MRALLARIFSVPRHYEGLDPRAVSPATTPRASQQAPARHTINFSWLDGSIWLRVYRIEDHVARQGELDVAEIGPRLVLSPIRIIASGFGGSVLHST